MKIKKKINKKIFLFALPILALAVVAATIFYVNTLTFNVGVKEPFEVKYAILGDGQNDYDGQTCEDAGTQWFTQSDIDISESDTILPGQVRRVCVKIENEGGVIPYAISTNIVGNVPEDTTNCVAAFLHDTLPTGEAIASDGVTDGITIDGFDVTVADNAQVIPSCLLSVSVGRGTA